MPLPTLNDCKSELRLDLSLTGEDAVITRQMTRAKALIEGLLGYPLVAAAATHTNFAETDNHGQDPVLSLPGPFKTTSPAPVVTDVDGSTVESDDYTLDPIGLKIRAKSGVAFTNRPYTIAATIGLDVHPDYASKYEAIASDAIIALTIHLYRQRNPGISPFTEEGGGGTVLAGNGRPTRIPDAVMDIIDLLPGRNGGMVIA